MFQCLHCRQELEVDAAAAGQDISCPACGRTLKIPPPGSPGVVDREPREAKASKDASGRFLVPVSDRPVQPLIQKAAPSLEVAARETGLQLRVKTIRHSDCREVGHDHFDQTVSQFLAKVGEDKVVSITPLSYSYIELGTQKLLTDFGVMVVFRG